MHGDKVFIVEFRSFGALANVRAFLTLKTAQKYVDCWERYHERNKGYIHERYVCELI